MTEASGRPSVAVVGAGITGLAVAYRLVASLGPQAEITVFEASERAGGKIRTFEVGDVQVEAGADSFVVRKPWAVDLCKELGLGDDLVVPGAVGAHIWTGGRLVPFPPRSAFGIPSRVGDLLRWKGLRLSSRLRGALDLYRPGRRRDDDESLGALLRRRLGKRVAPVMVEPLLAGLHAGDPERLSTLATFPELALWERRHGSLIRGSRAATKAAGSRTGPMFATVWGGLDRMIEALLSAIGPERLRLGTPVLGISSRGRSYELITDAGPFDADAVVLATPAFESARLLSAPNPAAASGLSAIPYASTAVAIFVYPEGTGDRLPQGTGFVTPIGQGTITACTWVSRKWPDERMGGRAVIRAFVGRAGSEEALEMPDDRLIDAVRAEVEAAVHMRVEPQATAVARWPRGMPQYEVGHVELLQRIDGALAATPGMFVAGSAYRGVGIPDCIRQAEETAARVLERIGETGDSPDGTRGGTTNEREAVRWTR